MYDPNAIKIYTDGSAQPNPGNGGIGLVIEYPDHLELENLEISEGYFKSNNQRMELLAVIRACEWFSENKFRLKINRLIIITDSEYVYKNYKNITYWRDNEWVDQYGKPYENRDLWETFLRLEQRTKFCPDIRWEKGKTRPILDKVDKLAKNGAKHPTKRDFGFQEGKFTSSRSENKKSATMYPANGQEEIIRVFSKKVYGKNEKELWKITFDIYSKKENKFTDKYYAYKEISATDLKRNNCYKVKFNNDSNKSLIIKSKHVKYKN